jgi:hypothetical protein
MLSVSEKIPPPRRPQLFNNYADEDSTLKKREEQDRWVKFKALAGAISGK